MKSDAEMRALSEAESVWPVVGVLNYLQALLDKSHIIHALDEPGDLSMVVIHFACSDSLAGLAALVTG